MKHIFLIVNNMNKVICEGVVKSLKLPFEDVIFLFRRPGIEKTAYNSRNFYVDNILSPVKDKSFVKFSYSLFILKLFTLKKFDNYIDNLAEGEVFFAYLPHVYQDDLAMVASHSLCKGVNIVEEGDASYSTTKSLDPLGKIAKRKSLSRYALLLIFGVRNRVGGICFFPAESVIIKAYSISSLAFCFYKEKKYLVPQSVCFEKQSDKSNNPVVLFLIDPYVALGKISQSKYKEGLRRFVDFVRADLFDKEVFISFHPTIRNNPEFTNEIANVFYYSNIVFEFYEGNIERLIKSHNDIVIYGVISSSMRYGVILGAKVYSWLPFYSCKDFKDKKKIITTYEGTGIKLINTQL